MAWVKIDDSFADHPKMAQVGPLGMALQVAALCYCNRYLTDGFIPKAIASRLVSFEGLAEPEKVIESLVSARVWDEVNGGYQVHDYLQYQPSRAQVEATREQRAEAGRKGGKAKRKQNAKQTASNDSSKTEAKSNPVPDPVPGPKPEEDDPPSLRSGGVDVDTAPSTPEAVAALWNEVCAPVLPGVAKLTEGRRTKIRARIAAERERSSLDWWRRYFTRIRASPFCVGENDRGWRADLDWAVRSEDVVVRVLEGRYDRGRIAQARAAETPVDRRLRETG